ncbi:MAG TPA: DUF202 domain-containing protein [Mucilaginibacter sp.]|jgi:putative membrane protein
MPEDKKTNERIKPTDHLANERTFLAWIRTSIALMGFGFVIVKFALFIRSITRDLGRPVAVTPSKGYSSETGIFLVLTGIIIALYAYAATGSRKTIIKQ